MISRKRREKKMEWFVASTFLAFYVWIWEVIFKKAGYSFGRGILMVIPMINLIVFVSFAFNEWPIERDLPQTDEWKPPSERDHITVMIDQAAEFERRGNLKEALELFEILSRELEGQGGSYFCAQRAKQIRLRLEKA